MSTSYLNAQRRERELEEAAQETADLIVIGGGITGVGIALDAVTRGLSVTLVEKKDLAWGTSRFSSKLAHGGLRYLTKLEFGIAHNSARERGIIMERTAPHLVRALPQVTALGKDTNIIQKAAMRIGFLAGDFLRITAGTSSKTLPLSHYANPEKTLELCPAAAKDGLKGSWVNYDGKMVDDARLVIAIARTAAREGAKILTYAEATDATANSVTVDGKVLKARAVINATGVWAGSFDDGIRVRPARGTHLVLDAETVGNPTGALTVPLPGSISRYLFILPAPHGRVYLGLTDEDNGPEIPDVPETPEEDIDFLLDNINRALEKKLTRDDVLGAFTGLRPLIDTGGSGSTADISRRHAIREASNGVVTVVGGKYTEYRLMAEETVDEALKLRGINAGPCVTKNFPLVGAPGHRDFAHVSKKDLHGLPEGLVERFGYEAPEVLRNATVDNPLGLVGDVTRAEIEFAVKAEGALNIDDVLNRRTRLGFIENEQIRTEIEEII